MIDMTITHSEYNKSYKNFKNICDNISEYIHTSEDIVVNTHTELVLKYLEIISMSVSGTTSKDYIIFYNKSAEDLYNLFKNIVPQFIIEEREKKINKIL